MVTPRDICNMALTDSGVVGVGQTALAEDMNKAFIRLNWMLAEWQRQRWLVYQLVDVSKLSTGANSYTVGPGGDFDTGSNPRPERLEAAFFRQQVSSPANAVDYPLRLIQSYEDYSLITLKKLSSFPEAVFLDSSFPLATLYPYPVPQANTYTLHLLIKQTLSQFSSLSQSVDLPAEYFSALYLSLAERLVMAYRLPADPQLMGVAKAARTVLRGANTQISKLQIPSKLLRPGIYNIYSDNMY